MVYIKNDGIKEQFLELNIKDNYIKGVKKEGSFEITMDTNNKLTEFVFPTVEEVFGN